MCVSSSSFFASFRSQRVDGASLFYTTPLPDTLQVLRQYALHLLFMPPAPSPGSETVAPTRNLFPFPHKPNTLDRDHIVIPAGWDSWGKIAVMRDGFEPKLWGEAWEHDLVGEDGNDRSAKKLFSALVPDQGVKVRAYLRGVSSHPSQLLSTADTTTPLQQSYARTNLPGEALRRERQTS